MGHKNPRLPSLRAVIFYKSRLGRLERTIKNRAL